MIEEEIKKIRYYFHALLKQEKILEDSKSRINIDQSPVYILETIIRDIEKNLPDFVPQFNLKDYYSHKHGSITYYKINGLLAFIGIMISKLRVEIENTESVPVTQERDFTFINNKAVRSIIERDYSEIQRAFISKCWKSVIILCGSSIEAILLDLLLKEETEARSSEKAPKENDLKRWSLNDLINVSIDLKLVNEGIAKLSHSIRDYRNIIHPGNEVRNKLVFGKEEAKIAIEVLNILHRELSR